MEIWEKYRARSRHLWCLEIS